jgi:hypothetical protein
MMSIYAANAIPLPTISLDIGLAYFSHSSIHDLYQTLLNLLSFQETWKGPLTFSTARAAAAFIHQG